MWILRWFGIDRSSKIMSTIFKAIGPRLPINKLVVKNLQNLSNLNSTKSSLNIPKIVDGMWDNFGRFVGEFPYLNTLSYNEIKNRIQIDGIHNVNKVKESNRPFILFGGHFANWDMISNIYREFGVKFSTIYRKSNNPYIDSIVKKLRQKDNFNLVPKDCKIDKKLLQTIKNKDCLIMLVDQKMNESIKVPFLAKDAMTTDAPAKIALKFNYALIPMQMIRINGSNFKIIIHPEIKINSTGNFNEDCYNTTLLINQILESWVIEHPEQWFWLHDRWGIKHTI
ncbi:MAG: lipid A biosynthesis lauroyl acyltransferase [Rickettsiaceae bacterium]